MKKLFLSTLAAGAIMMTGAAWAQTGSATVSPKTVPQTTQGITEHASDAAREALRKERQDAKERGDKMKSKSGMSRKDMKKYAK